MTAHQRRQLQQIIDHYGEEHQMNKTIEECSELVTAICKYRETFGNCFLTDVVDEIADVTIMLEQLQIILDCHGLVENRILYKILRQKERMQRGE